MFSVVTNVTQIKKNKNNNKNNNNKKTPNYSDPSLMSAAEGPAGEGA